MPARYNERCSRNLTNVLYYERTHADTLQCVRRRSFLPSFQSSLVMGSPFIKMIFSLLNCAATDPEQIKGWMFEVDGAVIIGAPF